MKLVFVHCTPESQITQCVIGTDRLNRAYGALGTGKTYSMVEYALAILPSEKAFAYKMKLGALKHQGKASGQLLQKLSVEVVAENAGESYKTVQRYIRLAEILAKRAQRNGKAKRKLPRVN